MIHNSFTLQKYVTDLLWTRDKVTSVLCEDSKLLIKSDQEVFCFVLEINNFKCPFKLHRVNTNWFWKNNLSYLFDATEVRWFDWEPGQILSTRFFLPLLENKNSQCKNLIAKVQSDHQKMNPLWFLRQKSHNCQGTLRSTNCSPNGVCSLVLGWEECHSE